MKKYSLLSVLDGSNYFKFHDTNFVRTLFESENDNISYFGKKIRFVNSIHVETLKEILNDLFIIYKKDFIYGDFLSFYNKEISPILIDCNNLLHELETNSPFTLHYRKEVESNSFVEIYRLPFYGYIDEQITDWVYIGFDSKTDDTIHFFKSYLKAVIAMINDLYFDMTIANNIDIVPQNTQPLELNNREIVPVTPTKIKFHGSQSEFIELIKALIENGNIKKDEVNNTQEKIFETLSKFFDIEINNHDKVIATFKNRNIGNETLFLNALKKNLDNYILSKIEKNTR